ncbi:putative immunity/bacteriocin fusion bifunctional protein [Bacillus toyonensis]|uniref:putative immunity/bacteriocin fusion bifunctional protein n=1 Tax=Bacillus toyonensis TaxID=155322 RepID=UPI003219464D
MFKKIIAVCSSAVILTLGIGSNLASANTITPVKECNSCTETLGVSMNDAIKKLEQDGTKTKLVVSDQEKNTIKQLVVKKDKEYKDIFSVLKNDGFKVENKADNYIVFENLKDENNHNKNYEKVATYTEFFYNKSSNELARKQVWVDLKSKEIVKYDVLKFETNGESDATLLVSYDKNLSSSSIDSKIHISKAAKFEFAGIGFACSMAGLIACAAAFGGLEVVVPILGVATSAGCAIAFNVGCSFA